MDNKRVWWLSACLWLLVSVAWAGKSTYDIAAILGGTWANRPTSPQNNEVYFSTDTDCLGNANAAGAICQYSTSEVGWTVRAEAGTAAAPTLQQVFTQGTEVSGAACGINPFTISSTDGTVGVEMCYNPTYGPTISFFPASMQFTLVGEVTASGVSDDGSGKVVCIKDDKTLGTCSSVVGVGGTCTCG